MKLFLLVLLMGVLSQPTGLIRHFKFDTSGSMDNEDAEMWIDFSQDPTSSPITSSDTGYSFVVNGSPTRGTDGTWPDGIDGSSGNDWSLSSGYLSIADGSGGDDFDPSGDFSVIAVVTFDSVDANTRGVFGKGLSGSNDLGWGIYATNNDLYFRLTDDGTTTETVEQTNAITVGVPLFIMATYDWVTDGSSEMNLYVDGVAVVTDSTVAGPVHDSSGAFEIGRYNGANAHTGLIQHVAYFDDEVLDADRFAQLRSQWYGTIANSGRNISVTNANPQNVLVDTLASGTQPFFVKPADDLSSTGLYGLYVNDANTNILQRSALDDFTAGSSCVNYPTGWVGCGCSIGVGLITINENNDHMVSGSSSMYIEYDGAMGWAQAACQANACYTAGVGQDVDVCVYAKTNGATQLRIYLYIYEYPNPNCGGWIGSHGLATITTSSATWGKHCVTMAAGDWDGATTTYTLRFEIGNTGAFEGYLDNMSIRVEQDEYDFECPCTGDVSCTCDLNDVTITDHGLSVGGWTMDATVRSPNDWGDATPNRYITHLPGTAGNNNRVDLYFASDVLTFIVYDKNGAAKTATVAAAGNADTSYTVRAVHAADGDIWVCFDGTCGARVSDAEMDGVSNALQLGSDGTNGADIWITDLKIYNRVKI